MDLKLADNIRSYRKARRLTQEQFAEMLGVSTGAVHKWEAGLSIPELELIMKMADFFDVSVDALLGYRVNDDRLEAAEQRLCEYCRVRDPEALGEAEKLLKKYPNSFKIVLACADIHAFFSVGGHRKEARRALELYEQALCLLPQNTDPEVSELSIRNSMAAVHEMIGEEEEALRILKAHNACGIFNDTIGGSLAIRLGRSEEAEPYLAKALGTGILQVVNTVSGFAFVFCSRNDYAEARSILNWGIGCLEGLKKEALPDFTDKLFAMLRVMLAYTELKLGERDAARTEIRKAAETAGRFDAAVNYGVSSLRFFPASEQLVVTDTLGATASESLSELIRLLKDDELAALWKEENDHE